MVFICSHFFHGSLFLVWLNDGNGLFAFGISCMVGRGGVKMLLCGPELLGMKGLPAFRIMIQ